MAKAAAKALTVVGELGAAKGKEFTYVGETDEGCSPCKLRKVCHGLEAHRRYKVVEVRAVKHDCPAGVYEGKVQVVNVEPLPFLLNVPAARLRGTMVTRHFEECGVRACPERGACAPAGVAEGVSAQILQVGAKVACPAGRDLKRVTAERA